MHLLHFHSVQGWKEQCSAGLTHVRHNVKRCLLIEDINPWSLPNKHHISSRETLSNHAQL
jgi:hypothetical protein